MARIVNLQSKYSKNVAENFTRKSYLAGKLTTKYDFSGVKDLYVTSIGTVDSTPMSRTTNSYGTPVDPGDTKQKLTMTQDFGWSCKFDLGDIIQSGMLRKAGEQLKRQQDRVVIPKADKYAFGILAKQAGIIGTIAAAPTKVTIIEAMLDGGVAMDNALVPSDGRTYYIAASYAKFIKLATEFSAIDSVTAKQLGKGVIGEVDGNLVVKVADTYLPTNCYFLLIYDESALFPHVLAEASVIEKAVGHRGPVMQGSDIYDCFVLDTLSSGVYACVLSADKQAAPTNVYEAVGDTVTVTSANATAIYYTTDGSDPRYSETRTLISSGSTFVVADSCTVKSVAFRSTSGWHTSNVTSTDVAYS